MSNDLHRGAARRAAVVLTAVCLAASTLLALTSSASADRGPAAYDRSISVAACDLLGRVHVKGAGCSRTRCVQGARLFRKVFGAEACQLKGHGFVATIDSRTCSALGRRWIRQVNYCASYPDRSVTAVYGAPQCKGTRSVYVRNTEADGYYDECLTPARVNELTIFARNAGSDLTSEASLRSRVQCQDRPATSYVDGRCVSGSVPENGGTVIIGDSLTWRGSDELGRMRRTLTIDGEPARRISELQGRLKYYASVHGQPKGLIIALGTVPSPAGYGRADLARTVRSVPRSTKVMFVLPYAALPSGKASPRTAQMSGWMRAIAKARGRACVADWPAVARRPGILQDGVHVRKNHEQTWAKFVANQWGRC